MKTKVVLSALFVLLAQFLFAQKNMQDVVYLKNGSVIRGFISEFVPEKSVTIKTEGQSIFVFEMNEVEKITREEPPVTKKARAPYMKEKGYFNETEFRVLLGDGGDGFSTGQSLITAHGYQVNRFFRIGAGVGAAHYNNYGNTFIPLFARVSGDMVKFRVTPIYFVDAGYGFLVGRDEHDSNIEELNSQGGLLIHAGTGLKFYTTSKASFTLAVGFSLQKSSREYQYVWSEGYIYKEDRTYQRMTLGFGVNF